MLELKLIYRILKIRLIYLLPFYILINIAIASSSNNELYINSDNFTFDRAKNIAIFKGDVNICFDNMLLATSEMIVIYGDKDLKNIEKIIIPAKLSAKKLDDQSIIRADKGEYITKTKELIITGNVKLLNKNHILKTNKLVYYVDFKKLEKK